MVNQTWARRLSLEPVSAWIDRLLLSKRLVWAIILTAVFLRCLHYFSNPSLWLDEARLALEIMEESFSGLLGPLGRGQMAPPGFLLITKLLVETFGASEYILRLFPFACGITSIFIFRYIVDRVLEQKAATIALALFALSSYLVHYSAEFKQYGSDVTIALILYALTIKLLQKRFNFLNSILFFLIGSLCLTLSHSSVFVLAGIGLPLAASFFRGKEWLKLFLFSANYLIWLGFFVCFVFCFSPEILDVFTKMQEAWRHAFMPLPPSSISDVKWFTRTFSGIARYPMGFTFLPVIGFVFLAGAVSMFKANRQWLYFLLLPLFIALLASGFRLYPFSQRLLLYSVPAVLIIVAQGVQYLRNRIFRVCPAIGLIAAALVFHGHLSSTYCNLLTGPPFRIHHIEEIKPVLGFIQHHKKEGDLVYVYYAASSALAYYAGDFDLESLTFVNGIGSRREWHRYESDLERLKGHNRAWILFSHVWRVKKRGRTEKDYILNYLDDIGRKMSMITERGASVYLYDLSQ